MLGQLKQFDIKNPSRTHLENLLILKNGFKKKTNSISLVFTQRLAVRCERDRLEKTTTGFLCV